MSAFKGTHRRSLSRFREPSPLHPIHVFAFWLTLLGSFFCFPPTSTAHPGPHQVGAQTTNVYGLHGLFWPVDVAVASGDRVQAFMRVVDGTRTRFMELGWTADSSSGGRPYIYTRDSVTPGEYTYYPEYPLAPGWNQFDLACCGNPGGGPPLWKAWIWRNGQPEVIATRNLGFGPAAVAVQVVEAFAASPYDPMFSVTHRDQVWACLTLSGQPTCEQWYYWVGCPSPQQCFPTIRRDRDGPYQAHWGTTAYWRWGTTSTSTTAAEEYK